MLLAQGRYWRATLRQGARLVALDIVRAALPEDLQELRELQIDVPLAKWNRIVEARAFGPQAGRPVC